VVAEHAGVQSFTIGQRKGLGVALGKPMFVTSIEGAAVRIGAEDDLFAAAARIEDAAWSDDVTFPVEATVRVRSRHEGARAVIERDGPGFLARFLEPVRAVSPGQVAVAYADDRVLGGGTITRAVRREEVPS
jgi:tRNA-specific 2-thiouridylase